MFTHLHVHTDNSLFDGYQTIDELVNTVKSLGQNAVAITDHGTMTGVVEFYLKCKEQGIKPILGNEFYFCEDKLIKDRTLTHHLVLLAKNSVGYMNLKKLNKLAYSKENGNFYFKPRIDAKELTKYSDGIICLSACLASIVNTDNGEHWIEYFKRTFGEDFYLEVQPHPIPEQQEYNYKLINYGYKHKVKLVVTTDAHYAVRDDAKWHKKWISVRSAKQSEYYTTDTNYLWSEQELLSSNFLPREIVQGAIASTQEISNKIELFDVAPSGNHFPTYPTNNPKEKIKDICREVWNEKVPKGHYKEYGDRFLYELDMLEKCGYLNYLLLTWDLLNWCRKQGIFIGAGRGSCAGSVVTWLLGIHCIDPIKYNLLFERFCNPERVSAPDIDNDVQTSRRGEVVQYLKDTYGQVMKIITYSKQSDKSAIQSAGKVLEIPPSEVDELTKQIETIDDVEKVKTNFDTKELVTLAKQFLGRTDKYGTHASAILVSPINVMEFCPMQAQEVSDESLGGDKVWTEIACGDFHVLENFGLLKEDILGLGTLDVIQNTLKLIGKDIDIYNLPTDDKNVFELYAKGNILGCFQMDSLGMRRLAKEMKVNCFENIIALCALFRPGPLRSGLVSSYIDGKNGGNVHYLCKEIKEVLEPTYNIIVYQEQVMLLARKLAGYTMGQADMLRKIIGRKETEKIEQATKDFKSAVIKNGFSNEIAEYIGNQIKEAGSYIFNKSHATSYGYLSYVTAYLKTYYPKEFMCSLINSKKKQDDVVLYVGECKRMGIKILPPNLPSNNLKWTVEGDSIRVGLCYAKGVGNKLVIPDKYDFQTVIACNNKKIIEGLIKAGALDYLKEPRAKLLSQLTDVQAFLKRRELCMSKLEEYHYRLKNAVNEKEVNKYTRMVNSWEEKLQQCNLSLTQDYKNIPDAKLENDVLSFSFAEQPKVKTAKIISYRTHNDKKGREMAFADFDTEYGVIHATIFAYKWKHWKEDFVEGNECYIACEAGANVVLEDFSLINK